MFPAQASLDPDMPDTHTVTVIFFC